MDEKWRVGVDIQVAILHNNWVPSLRHPDCRYAYMGDGKVSYLVSERFCPFWGKKYPAQKDFDAAMRRLGLGWKDILEAQNSKG